MGVFMSLSRKSESLKRQMMIFPNCLRKEGYWRKKDDDESREELSKVEEELANKCAEDNYNKIMDEIKGIDCEDGGVNPGKLWNLKRKLCPKNRDPPTAMLDPNGNLITSPVAI